MGDGRGGGVGGAASPEILPDPPALDDVLAGLTDRQKAWVMHYVGRAGLNATEAARLSGYKDPELAGWENRQKPAIREAVRRVVRRIAGEMTEYLLRLASIACFDYADLAPCFAEVDGRRKFDLAEAKRRGLGVAVRKVTPTRYGDAVEVEGRLEAITLLGRACGAWAPETAVNVSIEQIREASDPAELRRILDQLRASDR